MIIRIFRARLKPGKREEFERLCRRSSMPLMRAHPGCLSVRIRQPPDCQPDVFAITSLWKDLASLQTFAGENWREATILPGEADLLEEVIVQHYDEPQLSTVDTWHAVAEVVRAREAAAMTAPLTDSQWACIQPMLPPRKKEGRPRADDRRTLDGILYVLRTGCRWHDLPSQYGSAITCWRRFVQWEADGTWERIWHAHFSSLDAQGKQAWAQALIDRRHIPVKAGRWRMA
jgi:transposase/quinol monooxygenase YgiN